MDKKPEPCALTPAQEKAWSDTRVSLLWHCPAFSHIFYTMLDTVNSKHIAMFTKDVPIAATDGSSLIINPDTFFKYNLNERVFIVAHEIMHCIYNHCITMHQFAQRGKVSYPDGKSFPYDQQTMNQALDLVINDALIESKVGQFNKDWLHDPKIATAKDTGLDAYRKLIKDKPPMSGKGFDIHLSPGAGRGQDPNTASQQRNEIAWKTAIAAAANAARAQGKLPAGLERLFGELLDPQIDWREKIRALFARKVGSGSYNWQKPDRRLIVRGIVAPGRSGFGAGTVVVGCDTSGSIGEKELDMFFAEMAGILEDVRPRELVVIWCDAKVHRVDELYDPSDLNSVRCKGAPGGGGTDFRPVFDEIAERGLEPEALVFLTDGMGSFPDKPPAYPVIWGNIYPSSKYPFGDVVDVPSGSDA
ncbi:MAG TPA: VWA-like domain-containing protein [Xanthobacteraceae bacterium]|nr:VWA-like domain-containing protein [Xanthobacteraceae bacterium]